MSLMSNTFWVICHPKVNQHHTFAVLNVIYIYDFADECELTHIMGTSLDTTLGMGISWSP
jgi:hypothetical protein